MLRYPGDTSESLNDIQRLLENATLVFTYVYIPGRLIESQLPVCGNIRWSSPGSVTTMFHLRYSTYKTCLPANLQELRPALHGMLSRLHCQRGTV